MRDWLSGGSCFMGQVMLSSISLCPTWLPPLPHHLLSLIAPAFPLVPLRAAHPLTVQHRIPLPLPLSVLPSFSIIRSFSPRSRPTGLEDDFASFARSLGDFGRFLSGPLLGRHRLRPVDLDLVFDTAAGEPASPGEGGRSFVDGDELDLAPKLPAFKWPLTSLE